MTLITQFATINLYNFKHYRLALIRARRGILQKLDAILKILNALHNIKYRDLRSRVPLSHDTVKFLYREVPPERSGLR